MLKVLTAVLTARYRGKLASAQYAKISKYLLPVALAQSCILYGASAQTADTYQYDALGRLIEVADGSGWKTNYTYDSANNRSNVKSVDQFLNSWNAVNLNHAVGFVDGSAWAASVNEPPGHLIYGPYTYSVPTGNRVATYRAWVDDNAYPDTHNILTFDVFDAQTGQVLATRSITRHGWVASSRYQVFEVPFVMDSSRVGHPIEFRIWYHRYAYVKVDKVGFY